MPRGNGQGPQGAGPMTGRAEGFCAGNGQPGFMRRPGGRGRGLGLGHRRGYGFCRTSCAVQPAHVLERQAQVLQAQLDALNARIARKGRP